MYLRTHTCTHMQYEWQLKDQLLGGNIDGIIVRMNITAQGVG